MDSAGPARNTELTERMKEITYTEDRKNQGDKEREGKDDREGRSQGNGKSNDGSSK